MQLRHLMSRLCRRLRSAAEPDGRSSKFQPFPRRFLHVLEPSQPNYIAQFAGSTHGVDSNKCQDLGNKENIASQPAGISKKFAGYAESMPPDGYTGCTKGKYARKHNKLGQLQQCPGVGEQRFSSFPSDFTKLPLVAFATPDLCGDMHDCPVDTGDKWLKNNLDAYAQWAKTHSSLLIALP
ncbi:hypothetical protein DMH03_38835 [Amycolatopsis sp. WAC 01376]|uniref:alkaline phosphatase family protein n=1 Tax=Amycolatopsis sp. WAC 01376 TaxID=2203195 RepID=UPI000F78A8CD|nr:alkaline phosphatase family protein [Amycolatopsis sp. WAC 01376]RSM53187.1 hypothetical protein DMH03_38835 [Amycolatopsis sp. WAC 01376]